MSEKNKLQEYCQYHKISSPIYSSSSTGLSHDLKWKSSVTIVLNSKKIIINDTETFNTRIGAEKHVAAIMIKHIKNNHENEFSLNTISFSDRIKSINSIPNKFNPKVINTNTNTMNDSNSGINSKISETQKSKNIESQNINSNFKILESEKLGSNDMDFRNLESEENFLPVDSENLNININNLDYYSKFIYSNKKVPSEELSIINNNISENIYKIENIYIIDLENKPQFKLDGSRYNNCLFIGFINSTHNSLQRYTSWHICASDDIHREFTTNNCLLYLIEGGNPDLADHFMTMFIYPLINYLDNLKTTPTINIISGDHAGWCTRICLEQALKWKNKNNIKIHNSIFI